MSELSQEAVQVLSYYGRVNEAEDAAFIGNAAHPNLHHWIEPVIEIQNVEPST